MIILNKLNGEEVVLNSNLIELIENIPESKVSLSNGRYYLVTQSSSEIVSKIIEYNRKIFSNQIRIDEV